MCSSVLPIAAAPAEFDEAVTFDELLPRATSSPGGAQLFLGELGAGFQLNIIGDAEGGAALLLPLDADLPARLEVARQLLVWLSTRSSKPSDSLTGQQRTRLVEQLRAIDGKLDGGSIRDVAVGLFGADRLPSGRDWRAHDLRNRTRRLIDGGLKLMRGGYRSLLRRP